MIVQILLASALSWWDMTPEVVREKINQRIMSVEAPAVEVGSVKNQVIKHDGRSTPIRIYTPENEQSFPVIVFIHGGAWVAGNLDTHDNLARYLCANAQAVVVSVGYQNSPEGKFPGPLEQCYDALLWTTQHKNELHADTSRIAVVGDSAGGNMATALCMMVRDRQGPKIDLQVLVNPAPDLTCGGTIDRQNDTIDTLRWQAAQYVARPNDIHHPYVSPLIAKNLSFLPPAVVILAELDELRQAGKQYAEKLQAANVPVQVYCQPGVGHLAGDGARASLRAQESLNFAISALKQAFADRGN